MFRPSCYLREWCGEPPVGSRAGAVHLTAMVLWASLLIPTLLWWTSSVTFLVFVSLYANFAAHFSAWQGTRAESASTQ